MADDESSRPPIASGRQTSESESAHDRRPFGQPDQIAAHIAEKLRHSGVPCETVIAVPTQTAVLRHDRIIVLLALILLTALAWSYLLWLSADMEMGGMDMTGFRMIPSGMALMVPAQTPWLPIEFAFVFVMWAVMMVGMMAPSALPMFLMYVRVGRQTKDGRPLVATAWFATGYFLVWAALALLATLTQWAFERTELLDFKMASTSTVVPALLFVAAGSYQWTKLKDLCLYQCQKPFAFLIGHGAFAVTRRVA
jgi:predicted metal-binding membrane protein